MTGEQLAILALALWGILIMALWRIDVARWNVERDKYLDRIQSQVPGLLDRQDNHEERKAAMKSPEQETYGEDERINQEVAAIMNAPDIGAADGQGVVREIMG